jgi:hypothetical protein
MDIDDDGLPDVVATGGAVVSVLRDTPDANLLAVPNSRLDGPGSSSVASGDFDGDGYFDFAWIYANEVLVIQGGPGGRFTEGFPLDMGAFIGAQPGAVAAITFADDDRASLVVTTYSDVLLFRSNALGGFDEPVSIFNSFSLTQIAVGDFDGIGGYDVVVAQGCCGSANLVTLLGNGDGTFQPGVQTPLDADVYRIVAVDFTGGAPPPGGPAFTDDLIVVTNGSVRVMLSQPGGTFATSAEIPSSPYVQASVASGRFSGAADLLVGGDQPNVRLYPGNGNGTFQAPITIALPSSASSLIVGRFDEGTEDDFAALTQQGILVFLGLGDGHFQAPIALNTGVAANLIVTTDFANSGADGIAAIGNEGVAAFGTAGPPLSWRSVPRSSAPPRRCMRTRRATGPSPTNGARTEPRSRTAEPSPARRPTR